MSCNGISVVTMGCLVDPLDVCFGYQLANSRVDIGVIYAWGWYAFSYSFLRYKSWHTLEVLCVGLNIMNLRLCDAYRIIDPRILVVTLEYLGDIRV